MLGFKVMNPGLLESVRLYEVFTKMRWGLLLFVVTWGSDPTAELALPVLFSPPWSPLPEGDSSTAQQQRMVLQGLATAKNSQCLWWASQWGADLQKAMWASLVISVAFESGSESVTWSCGQSIALRPQSCSYFCVKEVWQCWVKHCGSKISNPQLAYFVSLNLVGMLFPFCFLQCYPALFFKSYPCRFKEHQSQWCFVSLLLYSKGSKKEQQQQQKNLYVVSSKSLQMP